MEQINVQRELIMVFAYSPDLRAYMEKTGKKSILVEMVEINNSDLEVSELHVRFADRRTREIFTGKKRYRAVETELGEVLLPPFPLQLEETVTFSLRSVLGIKSIKYAGIKI